MINIQKIKYVYRVILLGFAEYRRRFVLVIILGVLAGLFEGVGIGAIIPLFSLIINEGGVEELDFITRNIEKLFSTLGIPLSPIFLISFIIALFILKAAIRFSAEYINGKTVAEIQERLRKKIFRRSVNSSWPHLLNQKGGHLETLLIYDTERAAMIFGLIAGFTLFFTSFVMFALVAFGISTNLTLLTIGLGALFFFFLKPVFYRIRNLAKKASSFQKTVSHYAGETIGGAKMIKAAAVENMVLKNISEYFYKLKRLKIKTLILDQSATALIEPSILIIITILFAVSYSSPGFSIASFAVIIYLIRRMFSFVQSMQTNLQAINEFIPYLQNVSEYNEEAARNKEIDDGKEPFSFKDSLEFKNISFFYDSRKETLKEISFKIKKGEVIGIVGPSGSGKTTIVDLILRLFNPQKGQILIDGKNASEISTFDWRKNIGYVPQDTFLIHDTIKKNIEFFSDVPKDEIIKASKMANIYDTIQELPEKFDTVVGERGIKLSGGQRQRIALARALARKPQILILDEATSAVDNESEQLIQKSIQNLKGRTTILIIAHRPSTVMQTDNLFVLKDGEIIEQGKATDLLNNELSYFAKIN
ncbi:MAG: ABC transporter ATP-binding protein [Parcubacteria group bacterium]|nr:ABC transporter ATP-binding protein [Parcubacteria group bacterium]